MTDTPLDLEELKRLAARKDDSYSVVEANYVLWKVPALIAEIERLRAAAWWLAKMGTGAGCVISECTYRDSENCDCGILYRKAEQEALITAKETEHDR